MRCSACTVLCILRWCPTESELVVSIPGLGRRRRRYLETSEENMPICYVFLSTLCTHIVGGGGGGGTAFGGASAAPDLQYMAPSQSVCYCYSSHSSQRRSTAKRPTRKVQQGCAGSACCGLGWGMARTKLCVYSWHITSVFHRNATVIIQNIAIQLIPSCMFILDVKGAAGRTWDKRMNMHLLCI